MAMLDINPSVQPATAVVTTPCLKDDEPQRYLTVSPSGQLAWTEDPTAATAFASMRDATRAALRLPSTLRAFSLPREPEIVAHLRH